MKHFNRFSNTRSVSESILRTAKARNVGFGTFFSSGAGLIYLIDLVVGNLFKDIKLNRVNTERT